MLLLQHGAKIDNTTKDMYTSLHIAAKEGQDEVSGISFFPLLAYFLNFILFSGESVSAVNFFAEIFH